MTAIGPERRRAAPQRYSRYLGSCGHASGVVDPTRMTHCGRRVKKIRCGAARCRRLADEWGSSNCPPSGACYPEFGRRQRPPSAWCQGRRTRERASLVQRVLAKLLAD
jgi:hypothetical protein